MIKPIFINEFTDALKNSLVIMKDYKVQNKNYFELCKTYALKNKIYLVTAKYEDSGYLCMSFIYPNGDFKTQRACYGEYLNDDEINVIKTDFGNIVLAVDIDIFQAPYARLSAFKKADIIISNYHFNDKLLMYGPWNVANTNHLAVIYNDGIIVPIKASYDSHGFTNCIDLKLIKEVYKDFPIFDLMNFSFYKNYEDLL